MKADFLAQTLQESLALACSQIVWTHALQEAFAQHHQAIFALHIDGFEPLFLQVHMSGFIPCSAEEAAKHEPQATLKGSLSAIGCFLLKIPHPQQTRPMLMGDVAFLQCLELIALELSETFWQTLSWHCPAPIFHQIVRQRQRIQKHWDIQKSMVIDHVLYDQTWVATRQEITDLHHTIRTLEHRCIHLAQHLKASSHASSS